MPQDWSFNLRDADLQDADSDDEYYGPGDCDEDLYAEEEEDVDRESEDDDDESEVRLHNSISAIFLTFALQFVPRGGNGGPNGRTKLFFGILSQLPEHEIEKKLLKVLDCMTSENLDVATFLHYYSWGLTTIIPDHTLRYARTALMHSELLPSILENWLQPPPHAQCRDSYSCRLQNLGCVCS